MIYIKMQPQVDLKQHTFSLNKKYRGLSIKKQFRKGKGMIQ